jgi:hypothetical protein
LEWEFGVGVLSVGEGVEVREGENKEVGKRG